MSIPPTQLQVTETATSSFSMQQGPFVPKICQTDVIYHPQQPPNKHPTSYIPTLSLPTEPLQYPEANVQPPASHFTSTEKGKVKVVADYTPPTFTHLPTPPAQTPRNLAHEAQINELKTKLLNAISAVEAWKYRHKQEVEKNATLEGTVETLTADITALQATINLLDAEKAQLQNQLTKIQSTSAPTPDNRDIHIPSTHATPDKGKIPLTFPSSIFNLDFNQTSASPPQCQAITCYNDTNRPLKLQSLPPVATRTRSHEPLVSPPPPSAQTKLARNYKNYHPYRDLLIHHQAKIDLLASRNDLQGYKFLTIIIFICIWYMANKLPTLSQRHCLVVRGQTDQDHVR